MPIMDGFEFAQHVRKFCRLKEIQQPRIVACTGHTEDQYTKKAWDSEINEVISKPFTFDQGQIIIKELFGLEWRKESIIIILL